MKFYIYTLSLIATLYSCNSKQSSDWNLYEPQPDIDTSSAHLIFLTSGFYLDSVILLVNDSQHVNTLISTDSRLGNSLSVQTDIKHIKKLAFKVIQDSDVIIDTVYYPISNSKVFTIRKDAMKVVVEESNDIPAFW